MAFLDSYRELWRVSEKPGGERNFFDFLIYRRISTVLLMAIGSRRFSPNAITTLSVVFAALASLLFYHSNHYPVLLAGVVVMNISLILDTLDGQYSRYTGQQSEIGGWYDGVSDCLKYIFLFCGLCWGMYYHPYLETQWFSDALWILAAHSEWVLLMGMLIIANLFMTYYVHVSRYALSNNVDTVVNIAASNRNFHFGIESTLYTIFSVFLVFNQPYWLLIFLTLTLPVLWLYPMILVLKNSRR